MLLSFLAKVPEEITLHSYGYNMTNIDFYILNIIKNAVKADFNADDFPEIDQDVMHRAMLGLQSRGLLNLVDASADDYAYINVSITSNGLRLHSSPQS